MDSCSAQRDDSASESILHNVEKMDIYQIIKISGIVLGVVAFIWSVLEARYSYLYIKILLPVIEDKYILIRTEVENRSKFVKGIDFAFLLIGPQSESPIETIQAIESEETVELIKCRSFIDPSIKAKKIRQDDKEIKKHEIHERSLIPIPFYYEEQKNIGNELLGCVIPIIKLNFIEGKAYSIRFYVIGHGRLHRSYHEMFIFDRRE